MGDWMRKGISGSTLKIIAMVTMLIDHIGAVIIERMLMRPHERSLEILDMVLRNIGRIAFPIFCFLLVEGMIYTHNHWKYLLRLVIFAFVSEIPFNLAFRGEIWASEYQNVFFTLSIGLLVLIIWKYIQVGLDNIKESYGNHMWLNVVAWILKIIVTYVGMLVAANLYVDYAAVGVFAISVMYFVRTNQAFYRFGGTKGNASIAIMAGTVVLTLSSFTELFALVDGLFVAIYNGERGLHMKYVFYVFYPAHLLLLAFIAYKMGLMYNI